VNVTTDIRERTGVPFDTGKLDALMEAAGIDVLLATSKHNTQYLLGGYRFLFFSAMDAIGHSRYLPIVVYTKGAPDRAAYVAHRMERAEHHNHPFWTPEVKTTTSGTLDAAALAAEHLQAIGRAGGRIGIEPGVLPADAFTFLTERLDGARLVDATGVLERLRAIKTPAELEKLAEASERITDAMLATFAWANEGTTKDDIIERLRREEVARGLHFDYCLIAMGASLNRAGSAQAWAPGDVLSVDSGGNYGGYIGDLARMGVLGEPDAELVDLLAEIEAVQQAAFAPVRAGVAGGEIIAAAERVMQAGPSAGFTDFAVHGMGLVSHEVPFLMNGSMYEGVDAGHPLEPGMVLSVETTMMHPRRGFIKLEDTVAVTADGHTMFGDRGRGWNRGGTGSV
jgi:Xaa-Pro aminopeptidase